jgi:hypothetical protein
VTQFKDFALYEKARQGTLCNSFLNLSKKDIGKCRPLREGVSFKLSYTPAPRKNSGLSDQAGLSLNTGISPRQSQG